MDKKRKRIIAGNTVSQVYRFPLGGYKQKVLVEGRTKQLPVVIVLHGGPGTPLPFSVGCRGLFPEFTNRFLMVYWDQLGCGCNDHVIDESFCIDSFVQMACDLVKKVKGLFPDNKIYLFSMSWGTILSVKILEKDPYAADGVVAWGQIVRDLFFNEGHARAGSVAASEEKACGGSCGRQKPRFSKGFAARLGEHPKVYVRVSE